MYNIKIQINTNYSLISNIESTIMRNIFFDERIRASFTRNI